MRAAIYARRSTDEHQAASLETQIGEAKRYATELGWTIDDSHIFIDDAISRAEFKKRPALIAMLRACESKTVDVVITRDETRLGGDMARTSLLITEILDHGVRLHYYYTREDVRLDDATARFMVSARNFASELEREKLSQRTHENLKTKALMGLCAAGKCFGYRNVPVMAGDRRLHVDYEIDPTQAEVLRQMFQAYADGNGMRSIVYEMNSKGIAPPRAGKRGTGSWSVSSIRAMLHNERYTGVVVWNRENEGIYRGGTKHREFRPKEEWIHKVRPELRIISDELWRAVQARFGAKQKHGRKTSTGPVATSLLSSFARCGTCGGPINVRNTKWGRMIVKGYACKYHRDRGNSVCDCTLIRPVDRVDDSFIQYVESQLLREEVVTEALAEVRMRLKERSKQPSEIPDLENRELKLSRDIQRLTAAILTTDQPLESLTSVLGKKEKQVRELRGRIAALKAAPESLALEVRNLESEARTRIADLRGMIRSKPQDARKALEKILKGPLVFKMLKTPDGPRFEITGSANTPIDCVPNEIRMR